MVSSEPKVVSREPKSYGSHFLDLYMTNLIKATSSLFGTWPTLNVRKTD